jgi:hypothetical protein
MEEKKISLVVVSSIDNQSFINSYDYYLTYKKNNLVKVTNLFNTEISPSSGIGGYIYKNFKEYNENNNSGIFNINGVHDSI